jgi:integrase
VDGQRFRQSLETSDWREAQAKEKTLIAAAKAGKLNASSEDFARLIFEDAAEKYLLGRLPELAESSRQKERQLLVKPKEYFRGKRLRNIEAEDVIGFRQLRTAEGVGPAIINMEVGVIRRMLKRAKRWVAIAEDIKPLRELRSIGRAMSLEDKLRLLSAAGSNPDWENARLAMTLALCTTMRGVEIKNLRWRDEDAYGGVLELRERAQGFNGTAPDHFLFPACEHGHIDQSSR